MASASPARAIARCSTRRVLRPNRCLNSSCRLRAFHSHDHPPPAGPFGATEEAILSAAYKHVPEHGFTQRALGLGARDAGLLDMSPAVLTDGPFALIRYHLVTQRLALAAHSQKPFDSDVTSSTHAPRPGVGSRVTALTWARLAANRDVIHRWQEALAVMAQPTYVPTALKELAMLSDEIWFLAGDTTVDSSWYTKRASLSMVYTSTELFMTNDRSPNFIETTKFLDRRLNEVQTVGSAVGSLGQWAGFSLSAGLNVLRSKGVRI